MKISTKGRYGLRAILNLAFYGKKNEPVLLSEISEREGIPYKYLGQIMNELVKAGFVKSIKGRKGGYLLNKNPKNITIYEVLQTLEGDLSVADCVTNPGICHRASSCAVRDVFEELSHNIKKTLSSITLDDLIKNQVTKINNIIYNI